MNNLNFIKKVQLILFILTLTSLNAFSYENKILFKVDNEIITTIDLYNQTKYLISLNPEINKLEDEKIIEVSKNNLIREKIKKKEVLKIFKKIEINEDSLNKVIRIIFSQNNISDTQELSEYLKTKDINFLDIKEKITIEILWNQLIYDKFSSKLKIDKEKIREEILKNNKKIKRSYLLSEILFNIDNKADLEKKTLSINKSIEINGFKNTALTDSISSSSVSGGSLGWLDEDIFIKEIRDEINKLKVGEYTRPILTPSGFLILMIDDIKEREEKIDVNQELSNIVNLKVNQQLDQFSNIYFEKIKKDTLINEL